jgi:hypothetical protein
LDGASAEAAPPLACSSERRHDDDCRICERTRRWLDEWVHPDRMGDECLPYHLARVYALANDREKVCTSQQQSRAFEARCEIGRPTTFGRTNLFWFLDLSDDFQAFISSYVTLRLHQRCRALWRRLWRYLGGTQVHSRIFLSTHVR